MGVLPEAALGDRCFTSMRELNPKFGAGRALNCFSISSRSSPCLASLPSFESTFFGGRLPDKLNGFGAVNLFEFGEDFWPDRAFTEVGGPDPNFGAGRALNCLSVSFVSPPNLVSFESTCLGGLLDDKLNGFGVVNAGALFPVGEDFCGEPDLPTYARFAPKLGTGRALNCCSFSSSFGSLCFDPVSFGDLFSDKLNGFEVASLSLHGDRGFTATLFDPKFGAGLALNCFSGSFSFSARVSFLVSATLGFSDRLPTDRLNGIGVVNAISFLRAFVVAGGCLNEGIFDALKGLVFSISILGLGFDRFDVAANFGPIGIVGRISRLTGMGLVCLKPPMKDVWDSMNVFPDPLDLVLSAGFLS